jgi:hypothetical protein
MGSYKPDRAIYYGQPQGTHPEDDTLPGTPTRRVMPILPGGPAHRDKPIDHGQPEDRSVLAEDYAEDVAFTLSAWKEALVDVIQANGVPCMTRGEAEVAADALIIKKFTTLQGNAYLKAVLPLLKLLVRALEEHLD